MPTFAETARSTGHPAYWMCELGYVPSVPRFPQDANQNTTTYAYDARGRLATITYPIVPPATQPTTTMYTYDGMGRLQTTTDQAGKITTKTYDAIGRLSTVKDAILPTANVTQYFYDPNGNLRFLQDESRLISTTL